MMEDSYDSHMMEELTAEEFDYNMRHDVVMETLTPAVFREYYKGAEAFEQRFGFNVETFTVQKCLLLSAYCFIFLVGVAGNAWVAFVIGSLLKRWRHENGHVRNSSRRIGSVHCSATPAPRPLQIYIFALCWCDLIVLGFLLFLIADIICDAFMGPSFACLLFLCSESLNKFLSPFLLVALSGYCYVNVCRGVNLYSNGGEQQRRKSLPSQANEKRKSVTSVIATMIFPESKLASTKICLFIIAFCVLLVLALTMPIYFYGGVHYHVLYNISSGAVYSVSRKCVLHPSSNVLTAFTVYTFVCGYVVPAGLFTFFYGSIAKFAWTQARARKLQKLSSRGCDGCAIDEGRKKRTYLSKVVKTTSGLVLFYLSCWTPYWTSTFYHLLAPGNASNSAVVVGYFIHMLPYVNCSCFPIIYTVLNRSIKESYARAKIDRKTRRDAKRLSLIVRRQSKWVENRFFAPVKPGGSANAKYGRYARASVHAGHILLYEQISKTLTASASTYSV